MRLACEALHNYLTICTKQCKINMLYLYNASNKKAFKETLQL